MIWQKAMILTTDIYKITSRFPKEEIFGLSSQLRRCAVSLPSNIAEGYGRRGNKEFHRFILIAVGSLFELQTQLEIARNISYLDQEEYIIINDKSRELEAMIAAFLKNIRKDISNQLRHSGT